MEGDGGNSSRPPVTDEAETMVEKQYLLCLLNVAEELLALMPPLVQRKYGLIKGTLAVKLGASVDLAADSAILASLTSGIQPQVSGILPPHAHDSSVARAHSAPYRTPEAPGGAGHESFMDGARAAVVRSLNLQLAPASDDRLEHGTMPLLSSRTDQ